MKIHVTIQYRNTVMAHLMQCDILFTSVVQSFLGYHKEVLFVEKEALDVLEQFKQDLKIVECTILERNTNLEVPYKYLLPSMIVNSISI